MFSKTPHLAVPSEAEIRTPALDEDLAHQHAPAVPHIDAIAASGIHVPENVALDAVRGARVGVSKHPSIGQVRLIIGPIHRVRVDGGSPRMDFGTIAMDEIRVGDIARLLVRREANPVRASEPIGHDPDVARRRVEAVDMLR